MHRPSFAIAHPLPVSNIPCQSHMQTVMSFVAGYMDMSELLPFCCVVVAVDGHCASYRGARLHERLCMCVRVRAREHLVSLRVVGCAEQ